MPADTITSTPLQNMQASFVKSSEVLLYVTHSHNPQKDKDRETIVFVHGYPDNHKSWSHQMNVLRKKYNVAAFDLRGAGRSSAPGNEEGYHISRILPDVEAAINFVAGNDGKVHLVGHDWGAMISWCFISEPRYAKRIKSYTAVSCPHPSISKKNLRDKLMSMDPVQWSELVRQVGKSWYIMLFQLPAIPEFIIENFTSFVWERTMDAGDLPFNDEMRKMSDQEVRSFMLNPIQLYRQFMRGTEVPLPGQIDTPVQLIIPDEDLALTPELYDQTDDYVRNLKVQHVHANHWVHRQYPDKVNMMLDTFVAANS